MRRISGRALLLYSALFWTAFAARAQEGAAPPPGVAPEEAQQLQQQLSQLPGGAPAAPPGATQEAVPAPPAVPPVAPPPEDPNLITNSGDLEKKVASRVKDPFMLPNHLYIRIKKKMGNVEGEGFVDEGVEPQRRWALKYYRLVGIIWNVDSPKAMITDKQNTLHMFRVNDKIGNNEGQITEIHNGEVVVRERGNEIRLRLGN